jgi:hypothetical protein
MPILHNAVIAVIDPDKFTSYCLDPYHEDGKHKARVFNKVLGFNQSNAIELIIAIRQVSWSMKRSIRAKCRTATDGGSTCGLPGRTDGRQR